MGVIYPGACQVVVTINLEPEGGKCHGAMCVNKKHAFSKSRILQAVEPRPQPSKSCVPVSPCPRIPMSPLPAVTGSSHWNGSRCLQRHFTSSGCLQQPCVRMG